MVFYHPKPGFHIFNFYYYFPTDYITSAHATLLKFRENEVKQLKKELQQSQEEIKALRSKMEKREIEMDEKEQKQSELSASMLKIVHLQQERILQLDKSCNDIKQGLESYNELRSTEMPRKVTLSGPKCVCCH